MRQIPPVCVAVLLALAISVAGCQVRAPAATSHRTNASPAAVEIASPAAEARATDDDPEPADSAPEDNAPQDSALADNAQEDNTPPDETAVVDVSPPDTQRVHRITFDDLKLEIKEDMKFERSQLTETVERLEGKTIRVTGFIHPGSVFTQTGISQFVLIRNLQCKFGPGGQFHHNVWIEMRDGATTSYTSKPVSVEGVLTIQPFEGGDGNTWSIYRLDTISVK